MAPGFQKVLDSQVTWAHRWDSCTKAAGQPAGLEKLLAAREEGPGGVDRGGQQPWAAGGVRSPGQGSWQSAPLALTQAWSLPGLCLAKFRARGGPRGSRQLHHSEKGDPEPLCASRVPKVPHTFRVCTPVPWSL